MTSMLQRLFPCRFNEPRCLHRLWGCRCGKSGSSKKAENRADDLARQSQAQAQQQAAAQVSTGEAEQKSLESKFLRTPEEQQILDELAKRAGLTGEQLVRELGPTADELVTLIQQRLTTPPQIDFQSTLQPELDLANQNVANFAAKRGITGSGLELEQLGRTSAELAIREAQAREQNRLVNEQLKQETLDRATGLTQFGSGLSDQAIREQSDFEQALKSQELQGVQLGENALQAGLGRGFTAQQAGNQAQNQFNASGLQALQNRVDTSTQALNQLLGSGGKLLASTLFPVATAATGGVPISFPTPAPTGGINQPIKSGSNITGLPGIQSLLDYQRLINQLRGTP